MDVYVAAKAEFVTELLTRARAERGLPPAGERPVATRPEEFFAGHLDALAVYERVRSCLEQIGPFDVRTSTNQVAFRRRRGFAHLWLPGRYLRDPGAEVVLSIVPGRRDGSARFTRRGQLYRGRPKIGVGKRLMGRGRPRPSGP